MKKFGYLLISGFFIISLCHFKLSAQNIQGGTITYEQVIDYQLEGAHDDPRWDNYIADLPKTGNKGFGKSFVIFFNLVPKPPQAITTSYFLLIIVENFLYPHLILMP